METRANYTTIGAFTLIVIVAAFAFVYWFARPQDSEGRKTYEIVYSGTVSGLRQGNNVLFNGIPVGQVLQLGLVPGAPDEVLVRIGVQPNVPILADARATLESQGLTGIVAVSIRGGAANAAQLPIGPNGFPRIEAEGGSGIASLVETVQGVARRVNTVLEAIDPQKVAAIVANVDTFTKAVSDRSEDVGSLLKRVNDLSGQLNDLANKADGVLDNLKRATGDKDGMVQQVSDAAASVRRLSDNLDKRTADLAGQIEKFTGPGLRQYEALATDGRRTLSEIERVFKNLERNPRQFIFGGSSVPEYRR
ncbi:MlaD family protein [Roseixanthobacter liquoris]|uniref:MlaD family protein n=1 Tax=Roseixanthobacter liquoris TaxID=3119921 RepID=UPI0037280420